MRVCMTRLVMLHFINFNKKLIKEDFFETWDAFKDAGFKFNSIVIRESSSPHQMTCQLI